MIKENLQKVFDITRNLPCVLDIGGINTPLNTATHIADVLSYTKLKAPISKTEPIRYDESRFAQFDICRKPWPYPDKFFDFAYTAQTFEDTRDPIGACEEMMRVAKAGYIEVPSRLRESFHRKSGFFWRRLIGRPLRVGFAHHRWLCEQSGNGLIFTMKHAAIYQRQFMITASDIGRKLTEKEANLGFFWNDHFDVSEQLLIEPYEIEKNFAEFRKQALARIQTGA